MKTFLMLVGILLALLGAAAASPTGTPTTPEGATGVVLGPRRNGFNDLPSDSLSYNRAQEWNAIPDWAMASDPENGHDAIIYTREEIYTAMQQGYEVLQRTRDPEPGELVNVGNINYPYEVLPRVDNLAGTHWGRFGDMEIVFDMYAWPLLWTNSYTGKYKPSNSCGPATGPVGFNQNPGEDRVVFTEQGIYLGVITRRYSSTQPDGGWRWCAPTDGYGRWIAQWIGGYRGWDYTGVPPAGRSGYTRPTMWNIAASQRQIWWDLNPGGRPPTGSSGIQANSSFPPPVDMTPPGAPFDDDDPLQFPPADNSTGTWVTYVPGKPPSNITREFEPKDCAFARDHGAKGYFQSCQTKWDGGSKMAVRITISGTGQDNRGWCQGVMDNFHRMCGGNFHLVNGVYNCDKRYPGTATFSKATDPSDPGHNQVYFGIDMHFWMKWPWAESDSDHRCMSKAVEWASCGGSNVLSMNGKWCRNVYWVPSPPLVEWSSDMGIP